MALANRNLPKKLEALMETSETWDGREEYDIAPVHLIMQIADAYAELEIRLGARSEPFHKAKSGSGACKRARRIRDLATVLRENGNDSN